MVLHELSLIRATILLSNGTSSSDRSGLCTLRHAFQSSEDIHATVRLASLPKIPFFYRIFRCTLTRFQRSVGIDYIITQKPFGFLALRLKEFHLKPTTICFGLVVTPYP